MLTNRDRRHLHRCPQAYRRCTSRRTACGVRKHRVKPAPRFLTPTARRLRPSPFFRPPLFPPFPSSTPLPQSGTPFRLTLSLNGSEHRPSCTRRLLWPRVRGLTASGLRRCSSYIPGTDLYVPRLITGRLPRLCHRVCAERRGRQVHALSGPPGDRRGLRQDLHPQRRHRDRRRRHVPRSPLVFRRICTLFGG